MLLLLVQYGAAGIGREPEKGIIALAPRFDAGPRIVAPLLRLQNGAGARRFVRVRHRDSR